MRLLKAVLLLKMDGITFDTYPKEVSIIIAPGINPLGVIPRNANAYDTGCYTTMSSYELQHPTNDASNSDIKPDEEK